MIILSDKDQEQIIEITENLQNAHKFYTVKRELQSCFMMITGGWSEIVDPRNVYENTREGKVKLFIAAANASMRNDNVYIVEVSTEHIQIGWEEIE